VTDETYHNWFRGHPKPGDIIFVTKGSPGRVCLAPNPVDFCIAQDMVAIRANEAKVYPKYLFAVLRSEEIQGRISNMHVGTLIPHFKKGDFDNLLLPIPTRKQQEFIGDLYVDISARVDLLRQNNATLESIAQAIFKSWFIDYDPVRAKAEGRDPDGLDAATAALFPAEFEESALGLIPKGWSVRSLDSFATYLNGLALQKYPPESEEEYLPVIKIAQLRAGHTNGADKASARLKPEYVVHDGDVLFSWSGSLEVELWSGGDGALNQHLFKVTSSEVPKWFYYLATKHFLPSFREIAAHKATTMGHIQRGHLKEAKLAMPSAESLRNLSFLMSPLIERRVIGAQHARALAAVRDVLLPRLISGALRLPDTLEQAEETQT
jgi:type I restriction enzyme S subunit